MSRRPGLGSAAHTPPPPRASAPFPHPQPDLPHSTCPQALGSVPCCRRRAARPPTGHSEGRGDVALSPSTGHWKNHHTKDPRLAHSRTRGSGTWSGPPRVRGPVQRAWCSGAGAKGARQTPRASVFSERIREKSEKAGSSEPGAVRFLSPKKRWLESPWEHLPSQSGKIGAWSLQSRNGEACPCVSWIQMIQKRNAELGAVMLIFAHVGTPTGFRLDPAAMRGVPQRDAHEPTSDTGPRV